MNKEAALQELSDRHEYLINDCEWEINTDWG